MTKLFYNNRRVDPATFKLDRKDVAKLRGFCKNCGKEVRGNEALPRADPFASEILGDDTLIVQCEACDYQSHQET